MDYQEIFDQDQSLQQLIVAEELRQARKPTLIPSENHASKAVRSALASRLGDKYSEGYPGARFYPGNDIIDIIEAIAVERAVKLFGVPHANVQAHSGSPANRVIYDTVCKPGDTIMGLGWPDGGHLTHGADASITGKHYKVVRYGLRPDGYLDVEKALGLIEKEKPVLIWVGATAYPRLFPFNAFIDAAERNNCIVAADVSHIAGLIAAEVHPSPVPHAHIVTTTTHKTLRGPRGAIIMTTERGLAFRPGLDKLIDRTLFPGSQGGPHDNVTAAIAIALGEAAHPSFKEYATAIIENAEALASTLMARGLTIATNGTDNHLMLLYCGKGRGIIVQSALQQAGLLGNKNAFPNEQSTAFYPSSVRLGTPAVTTRGMMPPQMVQIAGVIAEAMELVADEVLPEKGRPAYVRDLQQRLASNNKLGELAAFIEHLCSYFPIPDRHF